MYKKTASDLDILRISDGAYIPKDGGNNDYREYLAWVAEGNAPDPYVPPVPAVPTVVDMAQARLALLDADLLATVDQTIAAMPGVAGDRARIEWDYRQTVRRDSELVQWLIEGFGWTEQTVDDLFVLAATK